MIPIAILGTGMAGCGASHRLREEGVPATMFDHHSYAGGHTTTFNHPNGFVFDEGPHISFTKDTRLQELFASNVRGEYEAFRAHVNNYWRGHWMKHPAPCNLHGLPTELVVAILRDFIAAQNDGDGKIRNYADWLVASYGRTFAETFPMEYGLKYHTTSADNMTTVWLGPRLYRPSLEEVLRGALSPATEDVHYVSEFRYPRRDGFVAYLRPFFNQADVRLGHRVVRVDPGRRHIYFANGTQALFEHLISSIPLPELIPMIDGAPDDVVAASERLACTTCVTVNLGIAREDISEAHWTYFYDRDFIFTRISFPHLFSRGTVPSGHGSIQAEIYFSKKYRPLDRKPDECIEPVISDLKRCGVLREDDQVVFQEARLIPYANVIFDTEREPALSLVHGFLDEVGIACCGRYGEWGYQWTDEAFQSGENAGQRILDSLSSKK